MCSLIYFFAKFIKILTTGSLEIGTFLLKQSVSIFRTTAHALHLTGFFRYKQKPKIAGFFASLPFLTYLCNKRLEQCRVINTLRSIIEKNSTVSASVEQMK